jgi:hypothetical protein
VDRRETSVSGEFDSEAAGLPEGEAEIGIRFSLETNHKVAAMMASRIKEMKRAGPGFIP